MRDATLSESFARWRHHRHRNGAVAASITPTNEEGLARYECQSMTVFRKPSFLNGPDACKSFGGLKQDADRP